MITSIEVKTQINAKSETVFKYLTDLSQHTKWNDQLIAISPQSMLQEKMKYRTTSNILGKKVDSINLVTLMNGTTDLVIENEAGPLHYRVHYHLEETETGTSLVCICRIESDSHIFKIASPLARSLAIEKTSASLELLKQLIEK